MSPSIRPLAATAWSAVRTAWQIVGMTVLLFVVLEAGTRAVERVAAGISARGAAPASTTANPPHPVASEPWYPAFAREFEASSPQAWRPYVYFRRARAFTGQYVNIDSAQHRVTPQPRTPLVPAARVFFFGGSTMWGSFQRDDHTIAAEAARRLQAIAPPGQRIEVTNLAETGHVNTQGLLELMLQLRAGQRPDVVVFYDGINDAFSVLQNGTAGVGQNEMNRVVEFSTGRRLAWSGHEEGLVKDLHSYAILAGLAFERTHVVQQLLRVVRPAPVRPLLPLDSAARDAVRVYGENVRIVEALARTYGFTPIYVWQPTLHATRKVLTPFEARLMARIEADPLQRRLKEVHAAVLPLLDSALAVAAPGRFVNEGALFAGDSLPVFTDQVGHNTERAIPAIVDGFWPTLQSTVKATLDARAKRPAR